MSIGLIIKYHNSFCVFSDSFIENNEVKQVNFKDLKSFKFKYSENKLAIGCYTEHIYGKLKQDNKYNTINELFEKMKKDGNFKNILNEIESYKCTYLVYADSDNNFEYIWYNPEIIQINQINDNFRYIGGLENEYGKDLDNDFKNKVNSIINNANEKDIQISDLQNELICFLEKYILDNKLKKVCKPIHSHRIDL